MKIKGIGRNGAVASVTVVVVALCLLFSYIYIQEDDDHTLQIRNSLYIGDYIEWVQVIGSEIDDTESLRLEYVFTYMDEQGNTEFTEYFDDIPEETDITPEEFLDVLRFDIGSAERMGSKTVTFNGIDYECGIYHNDDGDTLYVTDTGVILKQYFNGIDAYAELLSSSLLEDHPDSVSAVRSGFGQGEFIGLEIDLGGDVQYLVLSILEEHEGYDDVVIVRYSGQDRDVEYASLAEDELYELTFGDISGLEDAEFVGYCVEQLTKGRVICEILRNGDTTYHVGAFDNMIYGVYTQDSSRRVIGLSLLYDSSGGYDTSPADGVSPGDVVVTSYSEFNRYGKGVLLDHFDVYMGTALSVEDGMVSYRQVSLSDMYESRESVSEDAFRSIADPSSYRDIIGFEPVDTPMGTKLCFVSRDAAFHSVVITERCGVFDDVSYHTMVLTHRSVSMEYLSSSDVVVSGEVQHANPGFFDIQRVVYADGTVESELQSIVGFDERVVLVSVDGEQDMLMMSNISDPHTVVGKETIETPIGTYECEIYEYDGDDVIMRSWVNDSVQVTLRTEFYDVDGTLIRSSETILMSGCIGSIPGYMG